MRPAHLLPALRCLAACIGLALPLACGAPQEEPPPERTGPPDARWEIHDMLRAAAATPWEPADLGGRAWLVSSEPAQLRARGRGRFEIAYAAGPLGIVPGGSLYLQVSPFWGWSQPQTSSPDAPGYTTVTTQAADVTLEARPLDQQLLGIEIGGRALREGEEIHIVYGAGPAGAVVDRFADADARLWIAVDGNGDGVRRVLPESPRVEVHGGAPARLVVTLPSVARPGESVLVQVAVLDGEGNRGVEIEGEVVFSDAAPGLELPGRVALRGVDAGVRVVEARAGESGVVRLRASAPGGLEAESNPLRVAADGPRVLWGDLHGHSSLSDGTGTPDDYYLYARDVAGLDVASLTDHDHWGLLPLVEYPWLWSEIRAAAVRHHAPGRFVTLLGFEWTSWIYGHRHVLHFADDGPLVDSVDPATESPEQLWKALEGHASLTFAHHSAGGPVATDWSIPPDPRFEPVTEVVSVHGSSEALDSPVPIYSPVPGNFVRDALDRGYVLGFIGSGDSHDGHPGLSQLSSPTGGLAAILCEERTRECVLEALRQRRVYATNGPRILLRTALGASPMGAALPLAGRDTTDEELFVYVLAPGPLEKVELIRSGEIVDGIALEGRREATLQRTVEGLRAGEYVYVRTVQQDGGAAWSSPIFIVE